MNTHSLSKWVPLPPRPAPVRWLTISHTSHLPGCQYHWPQVAECETADGLSCSVMSLQKFSTVNCKGLGEGGCVMQTFQGTQEKPNATPVHITAFAETSGRKLSQDFKTFSSTVLSKCLRSYFNLLHCLKGELSLKRQCKFWGLLRDSVGNDTLPRTPTSEGRFF